ncbi:glycosyltransferase [Streptomyces europaeiscabiei]|uniref:glycosyltransferase n=1 Tax=Streptomyces europaeiscabiei TaxID=146819 RepID=UPI002E0D868A|nr:glycosyltransferase [Streptomyces europaeiscabiei]
MKILVTISDQVWGGKHRYMLDTVQGLRTAGHTVRVVVEQGGMAAAEFERSGFDVAVVAPFADDPSSCAAVLTEHLCGQDGPDAVCVTGRHDAAVMNIVRSGMGREPMIVFYRHSAFPLAEEGDARELLDRADLVVATSVEQLERQFGGTEAWSRSVVITSGIDRRFLDEVSVIDTIAARAALGIADDSFVFTVLARLSWEKGVDRAIRAMERVGESVDETTLLIAGDGPERERLEKLARDLDLTDRIRFLGHITDVAPVLAASDAVLLTSVVEETGPLALKEAMAAAKPVIASRTGGIPEFIADGVSGFLVSDDKELIDVMNNLWCDPVRAATVGRAAQEAVLGGHLLEHRLRYLDECLNRHAIRRFPLEDVLAEFSWSAVRWRDERESGFVFVPSTSAISELPLSVYQPLKTVLTQHPVALAQLAVPDVRELAEHLFDMGALVRSRQVVAG